MIEEYGSTTLIWPGDRFESGIGEIRFGLSKSAMRRPDVIRREDDSCTSLHRRSRLADDDRKADA